MLIFAVYKYLNIFDIKFLRFTVTKAIQERKLGRYFIIYQAPNQPWYMKNPFDEDFFG